MSENRLSETSCRVVTSGFAAVDVTVNGGVSASPGGTAVNVASLLARLGWTAEVTGTVGRDPAGDLLVGTLKSEGVGTRHLRQFSDWLTPIVVQERHRGDHVWRFSCPICGARFAKHRPPNVDYAAVVVDEIPTPDVFFFDRVSLFTIELARLWKTAGAFVFFEPAGLGRPALFERALAVADVVKYSSERAPAFATRLALAPVTLIETLGEEGARIRIGGRWSLVPGNPVTQLVDSAGAGDWTSAGIIDSLFNGASAKDWVKAMRSGQRLGADACGWPGVRPEPAAKVRGGFEPFGCPLQLVSRSA
jgi:fructokinase